MSRPEKELLIRDSKRNIGTELLKAIREVKGGRQRVVDTLPERRKRYSKLLHDIPKSCAKSLRLENEWIVLG